MATANRERETPTPSPQLPCTSLLLHARQLEAAPHVARTPCLVCTAQQIWAGRMAVAAGDDGEAGFRGWVLRTPKVRRDAGCGREGFILKWLQRALARPSRTRPMPTYCPLEDQGGTRWCGRVIG